MEVIVDLYVEKIRVRFLGIVFLLCNLSICRVRAME